MKISRDNVDNIEQVDCIHQGVVELFINLNAGNENIPESAE